MTWSNGKGRSNKYDAKHQAERKRRAQVHEAWHPCSRCRKPLGPMGPHLHLDHAEDGTYLGFAHQGCNVRAGASKGAQLGNALAAQTAGTGKCSNCGRAFARRNATQRFCGKPCRDAVLARRTAAPRLKPVKVRLQPVLSPLRPLVPNTCKVCGAATLNNTLCSKTCAARWDGKNQRPVGAVTYEYTCACCGVACTSTYPKARFCSPECGKRAGKRKKRGKPERSPVLAPRSDAPRAA